MEPGPDLGRWEPPSGILADYERLLDADERCPPRLPRRRRARSYRGGRGESTLSSVWRRADLSQPLESHPWPVLVLSKEHLHRKGSKDAREGQSRCAAP